MLEKNKDQLTFHEVISKLLEQNLELTRETYNLTSLNVYACTLFYQTIFNTVVEAIKPANIELSNEAMNYVCQQYYDGTLINGKHELDPNIFNQRAKLENIPTNELISIAAVLRGTDFLRPVVDEIKKRN